MLKGQEAKDTNCSKGNFRRTWRNSFFQHETGAALGQVPGVFVESLSLGIFSTHQSKPSSHMI